MKQSRYERQKPKDIAADKVIEWAYTFCKSGTPPLDAWA